MKRKKIKWTKEELENITFEIQPTKTLTLGGDYNITVKRDEEE